ncbi:hypothetical protein QFC19_000144 [Naganishia cerealis]|uniref:Uncharacterized protein n=1 Tax=Naganishia cerealis TaxID=610337 RepID=A0ACC2WQ89_9TREE|nr:hypothetical protein QFC19_000144 [Naganishia cerealis]
MNKRPKAKANGSPFTVGTRSHSKPSSSLKPVASSQFYPKSSNATASSRRGNPSSLRSPSNPPIGLAPDLAEQEYIVVDPEEPEEIESPDVTHVSPPLQNTGTPTKSSSKRPSTEAEIVPVLIRHTIPVQPIVASPTTTRKKVMNPRPVEAKVGPAHLLICEMNGNSIHAAFQKTGTKPLGFTGPSKSDKSYPIKTIIVDDQRIPPSEFKNQLVLKVAHMLFKVCRIHNPTSKPDLEIPLESGIETWIASKSEGPVSGIMIDGPVTQRQRAEWYKEFPCIGSKAIAPGRSRMILLVELEEPIEKSTLLKSFTSRKPEVVINEGALMAVYMTQLEAFNEANKLPSPSPRIPVNELSKSTLPIPTRPTAKKRTRADQPETTGRDGLRQTRIQPDRLARTNTPVEPREAPVKKAPLPKNPDEIMREWPSHGRSEVNITRGDFYRLEETEYLNDTLIEFGLKYHWSELPEDKPGNSKQFSRDDIHIFNSFFYKKLSVRTRQSIKEPDSNAPSWPAYETVRKWTRKVDVFSKRMLVIPINENLHWYLAVILNPGAILRKKWHSDDTNSDIEVADMQSEEQKEAILLEELEAEKRQEEFNQANELASGSDRANDEEGDPLDVISSRREDDAAEEPEILESLDNESDSEKVERTIAIESPASSAQAKATPEPLPPPPTLQPIPLAPPAEYAPVTEGKSTRRGKIAQPVFRPPRTDFEENEPVIMTFDSLGGSHQPVGRMLNKWLTYEARDKAKERTCLEETHWDLHFPAAYKAMRVPGQDNFADCGIYVLHYAIQLMKDKGPLRDYIFEKSTVKSDKDKEKNKELWDANDMSSCRDQWKSLIRSLPSEKGDPPEEALKDETRKDEVEEKQEDTGLEISIADRLPEPPHVEEGLQSHLPSPSSNNSELPLVPGDARWSADSPTGDLSRPNDTPDYQASISSSPQDAIPPPKMSSVKRSIPISPVAPKDAPVNKRRRLDYHATNPDIAEDSEEEDSSMTANQPMDLDAIALPDEGIRNSPLDTSHPMFQEAQPSYGTGDPFFSVDEQKTTSSVIGLQTLTNGMRNIQVTSQRTPVSQRSSGRPSMISPQSRHGMAASYSAGSDIASNEILNTGRKENIRMQLRNDNNVELRQETPMRSLFLPISKDSNSSTAKKENPKTSSPSQTLPASLNEVRHHFQIIHSSSSSNDDDPKQIRLADQWYPPFREGADAEGPAFGKVLAHLARVETREETPSDIQLPLTDDESKLTMTTGKNGHAEIVNVSSDEDS